MAPKAPSGVYCLKCKDFTPSIDPHVVKTANGRYQLACTCTVCKKQKRRMLSKADLAKIQSGKGLFDFLGKDIGGFLNKVGNTVIDTALPIGASMLGKTLGGFAL